MSGINTESFDWKAKNVALDVALTVISKQHDYGKDNIMKSVVDSRLAIAVRLQDKISRLVNLVNKGTEANFESLEDTAKDIMGYGLILAMVINGTFENELESGNESN